MKCLYKYPQAAFPYEPLRDENRRRTRQDPEFELLDTGVFDENRYFDVFVEYAKASPDDISRSASRSSIADPRRPRCIVLPTVWFRNTLVLGLRRGEARTACAAAGGIELDEPHYGKRYLYAEGSSRIAVHGKRKQHAGAVEHCRTPRPT